MGAGGSGPAGDDRPGRALGLPRRLQQHRRRLRVSRRGSRSRSRTTPTFRRASSRSPTARGATSPNPGDRAAVLPGEGVQRAATSASRPRSWRRGRTTTSSRSPNCEVLDADGDERRAGRGGDRARLDRGAAALAAGRTWSTATPRAGPATAETLATLEASAQALLDRVADRRGPRGDWPMIDELSRRRGRAREAAAAGHGLRRHGPQRRRAAFRGTGPTAASRGRSTSSPAAT